MEGGACGDVGGGGVCGCEGHVIGIVGGCERGCVSGGWGMCRGRVCVMGVCVSVGLCWCGGHVEGGIGAEVYM